MAILDKKISEIYSGRDIASLSDRPNQDGMTATNLKARFDQLGKEVIPKYNALIDEMNDVVLPLKADKATTVNGHPLSADVVVTKADVGLSNADNTADANKPLSTASTNALALKADKVTTINGHALDANVTVSKADVGLGNADNTSDANKPISTAQAEALALKADKTTTYTKTEMQTSGSSLMHWGNITNKPNFADYHWKSPVANRASLPLTSNELGDNRVVLNDGDGKQAVYTCIALTGDVDAQWSKVADVDWMTEEQTRITQELARVSAENSRVTAEGLRVTAESGRVSAEDLRVIAEGLRVSAESARADAEVLRLSAESTRISNENVRVSQESARNVWEAYNALTAYVVGNKVSYLGSSYRCILASTGNLPTNTTYWLLIAQKGDNTSADQVTFIPTGNLSSINVQTALAELDTEKASKTQETWITPTLLNGWKSMSGRDVQYMKDAMGFVHFRGDMDPSTRTESVAFQVPIGYRPSRNEFINIGDTTNFISCLTSGLVSAATITWAWQSLIGFKYKAG